MNNALQASRAGPSLPIGQSIKPAPVKESLAGTLFAAFLTSEIKRDQERRTEESDSAGDKPEPAEKPEEPVRNSSPVRDPLESLMAVAYQAPAKPPETPASDGDGKQFNETGSLEKTAGTESSASNETSASGQPAAAPGSKTEAAAQAQKEAQSDAAVDKANAAPTAEADTFQAVLKSEAAATAVQAATSYKMTPEVANPAGQPDLADLQVPAAAVQTKEGAANPTAQADLQAASSQASGTASQTAAAAASQDQNPAKMTPEQAKAAADAASTAKVQATAPTAPGGAPREVQTALGGTTLSTNPLQSFEPARLAEAQNKNMIWQVCQNVETMLKNRQTSMRLTLFPEDLGRIDLRLTSSSSGMGISMVAQQANTGHMLESQLAQLRQALDQAGIQLSHLSVGQQNSQAGSDQPGQQSRGQSSAQPQNQALQPLVEERGSRNSLDPSEGYDYLV